MDLESGSSKLQRGKGQVAVRRVLGWLWTVVGPFVGLLLIFALFWWLTSDSGAFLQPYNLRLIAVQSVIVGTAALGLTIIMIAGGIDLSVGSAVALVTVVVASLASGRAVDSGEWFGRSIAFEIPPIPLPLAMLGGVVLGGLCGLFNGSLITRLGVLPFIITLGTMKIFRGLAKWEAGSTSIYVPEDSKPWWFSQLLATDFRPPESLLRTLESAPGWLGRTLPEVSRLAPGVWMLVFLGILVSLMLKYSLLGRYTYAVGSNEATARLCGLRVKGIKLVVYGLAGLLIGLAGVLQFTYLGGTGDPTTADGLELMVIAAVVIGGGSLSGGEGTVLGTLIGVLIISVLNNGCVHAGIPNATQDVIIGSIIIVAVALDRLRRRNLH